MIKAILILIRLVGVLMDYRAMKKGEAAEVARELSRLNARVGATIKIVEEINNMEEDEINNALRG